MYLILSYHIQRITSYTYILHLYIVYYINDNKMYISLNLFLFMEYYKISYLFISLQYVYFFSNIRNILCAVDNKNYINIIILPIKHLVL